MNSTYKLRRVGGALVVTIPQHLARIVEFSAGDEVRFTYTAAAQIIIEKPRKAATKPAPKSRRNGARK